MAAEFAKTKFFKSIQIRILDYSKLLSLAMERAGLKVITGGTDNHIVLIESNRAGDIVKILSELSIRCNANPVPNSRNWGIRFGTTAIAQSKMTYEEVSNLFMRVANVCAIPSDSDRRNYLENAVNKIIEKEHQKVCAIEDGNWTTTGTSERDVITSKSLIYEKVRCNEMGIPVRRLSNAGEKALQDCRFCVTIIPTIGINYNIKKTIDYINSQMRGCSIYIVDSGFLKDGIELIDESTYHIPLRLITEKLFKIHDMKEDLGFNIDYNLGKGWAMYIGYIMSIVNKKSNIYFIDDDLDDIYCYDPLKKLSSAAISGCDHAIIATPKRRNEIIHGVLNAYQIKYKKDIIKAKSLIHFLAGERYIKTEAYYDCPWLSNYGIETWLNLYSVHYNHDIIQMGNLVRRDAINSYYKNETMLMYVSKLISMILESNILSNANNLDQIKYFNSWLKRERDISILPLEPGKPIECYCINCDCMIPAYNILKRHYMKYSQLSMLYQ
jgi:hypothetical protein